MRRFTFSLSFLYLCFREVEEEEEEEIIVSKGWLLAEQDKADKTKG